MGKKDKECTYEVSPALMYSGLIPVLRKPVDIYGSKVYVTIWFDNIVVRSKFLEKMEDVEGYEPGVIPMWKLSSLEYAMDLEMGKVVYKVKKKKVKSVPLRMLYEFYQQYVNKVVDK